MNFYVLTTTGALTVEADFFERWDREFYGFFVRQRQAILRERIGVFGGVRASENIERTESRWCLLLPASVVIAISTSPIASAIEARSGETVQLGSTEGAKRAEKPR
jgi:hypothetical protein